MDGSRHQSHHHHQRPAWSFDCDRPSRRLKDSCDMCSASKVRCDRQKPICGRCQKLAYLCFYSPARRVGRPQGRTSQRRNRRDSAASTGLESESVPLEHSAYPVTPVSPIHRRDSSGHAHFPSPLDTPPPALSLGLLTPPVRRRQQQQQSGSGPEPVPVCSSSTTTSSSAPPPTQTPNPGRDCVQLAIITQRQLEAACHTLRSSNPISAPAGSSSSSPWTHANIQSAEAAMQTAGAAMRRMATTLICPCAERLETGVLVSAACLSILDLYGAVVGQFADDESPPPRAAAATTTGTTPASSGGSGGGSSQRCSPLMAAIMALPTGNNMNNTVDGWNDMTPFSCASSLTGGGGSRKDLMLVHVLGELSKLATVVYQFTKRYGAGAGAGPAASSECEILQDLAAFLKSRLKAVGDETAARLQTSPLPRRGTCPGETT